MDKILKFFTGVSLQELAIDAVFLLACALGGFGYGMHVAHTEDALAEAGRTAAAVQAKADADAKVLERERTLRAADRKSFDSYRKEQADAQAENTRLIARLRAGTERLRVPVRQTCPASADPGGPAAGGSGQEGYAELGADAAEFVVDLLQRGDDAIRKHAEVVDRYNRLAAACMADDPVKSVVDPDTQ